MKRKMYWGISILIILFIGASVFMLMRNTDIQPEKVYIDLSEEQIDDIRSQFKTHSKIAQDVVTKQVSEGSDHEDTRESPVNIPKNESVSVGSSSVEEVWTLERLVRRRDSQLKRLPEHIAILENLVAGLEETYNRLSIYIEKGTNDPLLIQQYNHAREHLPYNRGILSRAKAEFEKLSKPDGLEYLISSMGLEGKLVTEGDNEK